MRFPSLVAAAGATALLSASPALANGRYPAANQIAFAPSDPNLVILRATFGILPSHDNGATWSFLCEDVFGLPPAANEDPTLGLTANKTLVVGLPLGLDVSNDTGCNWACANALAGQAIADVVVRRDSPHVVLALTSTYVPGDAGVDQHSQVFQSTDDGASWAALGVPIDPAVSVTTLDVAPSDSQRLYVSGTRGYGTTRTASLFVWTGQSAGWAEYPLTAFDPRTEDSVFIGAVDPTDADRVYLRSSAQTTGGQSRLFVTSDAGKSFVAADSFQVPNAGVLSLTGEMLGFALSVDGSKIYAGSMEDGLFVASRADMKFKKTSSIHVQCLATRGSELWACSDGTGGFVAGVSMDDGVTFTPRLSTVVGVEGPIACKANTNGSYACTADANASQCSNAFEQFCDTYGPCTSRAGDGGPGDDAGSGRGSHPPSASGCSVGAGGVTGLGALCAAAVAAIGRRKGKPRRS